MVQLIFENKKNHVKVIAFNPKITTTNIKANFFPINDVSGSSLTLIKSQDYFD